MRKRTKFISIGLIATMVISLGGVAAYAANEDADATPSTSTSQMTLESMLDLAIQDEYTAKAEYTSIVEKYGEQIPYTHILEAEERHIENLTELLKEYNYEVPADHAKASVVDSLEASYALGVSTEEKNIAMYESLLTQNLPEDVEFVIERSLRASQNHLNTFENAVNGIFCDGTRSLHRGQGNCINEDRTCDDDSCSNGVNQGDDYGARGGRGNGMCSGNGF